MKKYILALVAITSVTLTSCNDWLDVRGDMETKEEELFSKKRGFCDALTGCYMSLADQNAYGEKLTMSNIESLANLWYLDDYQYLKADYYLKQHNYEQDDARAAIKAIYAKLFNVVTQANTLLKNLGESGDVIVDPALRAVIEGEAYAIRAYCQFDILRLFGQLPQNGTLQVSLPYSETASIDVIPPYYTFSEYVTKLENDIDKALGLLKDNDPIFQYTFTQLNNVSSQIVDEESLYFRQSRLNYWAVKGLQARMYLYLGNKSKAHSIAMDIINAKNVEGSPVRSLNSVYDLAENRFACPSECLFNLSKYDLLDYTVSLLYGGAVTNANAQPEKQLLVSSEMLTSLYAGMNTASHNRYQKQWNRNVKDAFALPYAATKKYYYTDEASSPMVYNQIIPMIRMSEIYLIAIEGATDLPLANSLYDTYMRDRNILSENATYFTSLEDIPSVLLNEYRREFYAEGQMFYTYKRTNATTMMFRTSPVTESEYIIPLPDTEFNPNDIQN